MIDMSLSQYLHLVRILQIRSVWTCDESAWYTGILRNVSPLPPPMATSNIDIDKDIVLPLLQPVISSMPLLEASNMASNLLLQEVSPLTSSSGNEKDSLSLSMILS
jgi:hypothetical protein